MMKTFSPTTRLRAQMLSGMVILFSGATASGLMDLEGQGISEIWKMQHGPDLKADADDDLDGYSNLDEAIMGTDPRDRESSLRLVFAEGGEGEADLQWQAVRGKVYRLEVWNALQSEWLPDAQVGPVVEDGPMVFTRPLETRNLYRLVVSDIDQDEDGLNAWEEGLLGYSDSSGESSGIPGTGDFRAALLALESEEGITLENNRVLSDRRPSRAEAARFLIKATFGPTDESIDELVTLGYRAWLDNQFALPVSLSYSQLPPTGYKFRQGWWRMANTLPDQLRQRMAYALSQILVVDFTGGTVVGDNPLIQADYYDIFTKGAFGDYREVLEEVTYHPAMGFYLSHLRNRKADPTINRFPDENFAREIMQLFTIGLWELNQDGTRKLTPEGDFIPTYDNATITEMARVFTGMSFTKSYGVDAKSFLAAHSGNDYLFPMKVWLEEHDTGPKTIIGGVFLEGRTKEDDAEAVEEADQEVQAALDALVAHDNLAPFLSRLLIQRFTSSNPSPGYLSRVSRVWKNDEGALAPMSEVVEAILLDPETMTLATGSSETRGKVREPVIRFLSLLRAFRFANSEGNPGVDDHELRENFGQFPTQAPSVFNFYLPDFSPSGELKTAGLYSPEMQLATAVQLIRSDNRFQITVDLGHYATLPDFSKELALVDDIPALIERIDLLLTGGRMKSETRTVIAAAVASQTSDLEKVRTAVHLVSQCMEAVTIE